MVQKYQNQKVQEKKPIPRSLISGDATLSHSDESDSIPSKKPGHQGSRAEEAEAPLQPPSPLQPPPPLQPPSPLQPPPPPLVLQRVQEGLSLSQEAVNVMDSFVKDIFERITDEAARLVRSSKRSILTSRDMQTSVRLLLPGKRGKHAISSATKAVIRYLTGK
ncbi:late histone H2B.L4-like [Balaenoptera ricei]|uniref:late histone H2B.L4-like n=1 Tax=Balaenoptera ricei TaxID=2746895 RepID=UPI0028BF5328|nr:late histone H2B.L4-like [Balaenoptera ricei]